METCPETIKGITMAKKIVVADDSSTIRGVAESLLRQKGYEVFSAPDGENALTLVEDIKPDLVLLDYSMPEPNGINLCKQLRERDDFKETPIIIMANARDSENVIDFVEGGATETMIKPFTPRELNETVERFINKEKSDDKMSDTSSVQIEHNLINRETDEDDSFSDSENIIEPDTANDDTSGKIGKFSLDSDTAHQESESFLDLKDEGEDFDFTWSDLSLDAEEFIKDSENDKSPGDSLLEETREEDDMDNSVSMFIDNYDRKAENHKDSPHDYDWFINEMNKENKGEKSEAGTEETDQEPDMKAEEPETEPAEDKSEGTPPTGVKATEKYEEFISAFRDDIKGLTKDPEQEIKKEEVQPEPLKSAEPVKDEPEQHAQMDKAEEELVVPDTIDDQVPIAEQLEEVENTSLEPAATDDIIEAQKQQESKPEIDEEVLKELSGKLASELADKLAKEITSKLDNATLEQYLRESLESKIKEQNR
ncbi:MAG: response regulator [candidate division Zixibacteria bacterium]|nr:response regulator [candidate division Zixibacteria bacterium]